jgi:FdhD protein
MPADPPTRTAGLAERAVIQVQGGQATATRDYLAEEVPVAIHYNGEPHAVMMASPGDLDDFAYGFSLSEHGIGVHEIAQVQREDGLEGIRLDIRTHGPLPASLQNQLQRSLPGRSGCGICGHRLLEEIIRQPPPVGAGPRIDAQALHRALAELQTRQPLNAASGALHAAAWALADGRLLAVREDVGRHNALDKLIGALARAQMDRGEGFAVVTSRASYEMVSKAAIAGMPLLLAISAPTALAVDLANSCGLTLVGFVRPGRHVIYSHAWRMPDVGGAVQA